MVALALRAWVVTLALALGIAVAGWWAWTCIPVDAIPDLSDNQVIVWSSWPGQSPDDVDRQVTARITRELQGLPGVTAVRGLSLYGSSYVYAIFSDDVDFYTCRTRTQERLSQFQGQLPAAVTVRLGPDATAMGQVYAFALRGPFDPEAKRRGVDQLIVPALSGVAGVAEVAPVGGVVREYHIDVDPARLEEQGLTIDMLMLAVRASGRDIGAMAIERSGVETMLRGVGFIRSAADVEGIVIRNEAMKGAGLRLGDIATVAVGGAVRQGLLADEHGEQVGVIVAMRAHADPTRVIAAVKARLRELAPALAARELSAIPFYDRSQLIQETTETLVNTLREEIVVTVLVVLLFLLHLRASIVVAVCLPLGVALTFLAMHGLGVGANLMSLAGIAIAIGVMVDFGIVMTENITQHVVKLPREQRTSPWDERVHAAVRAGAQEVTRPLLTAAATTIVGFLPIFALSDQAGRLFIPLALTKTLAISAAVLFGMILVPVLCRLLLPGWQVQRRWLALIAVSGGVAAGLWFSTGLSIPMDHGRWAIAIPGWIIGPAIAVLVGLLLWRLGREAPVDHEHNPVGRAVHVVYDWALTRLQRHKQAFIAALAVLAGTGFLLGLGWTTLSWPLRQVVGWAGGDLNSTRIDRALAWCFPGVGSAFMPPLDEGALLFMPSLPATAGVGETLSVMSTQNRLIAEIPEVAAVMGKMGRAESALDPAPIGMIETVVVLKPYAQWPVQEMTRHDGSSERRPRTLMEVRAALSGGTDIPGVAPAWLQPIETRVVMLSTGIRAPLALRLLGSDPQQLENAAEQLERVIAAVPGTHDVQVQREGGKPYGEIRLDAFKLARFGITVEQVMQTLETAVGGMPLAWSFEGNQRYAVRIRYARERRDDPDELAAVQIPGSNGHGAIALRSVLAAPIVYALELHGIDGVTWLARQPLAMQRNATVSAIHEDSEHGESATKAAQVHIILPAGERPGPSQLGGSITSAFSDEATRWRADITAQRESEDGLTWTIGPMAIRSESGKRSQFVLFNVLGRSEGEVVAEADQRVRAALTNGSLRLPPDTTYQWVGRYEQQQKAASTMRWVIAGAVLLMIVLIWLGTRSWLVTSIIVSCNLSVTTAGGLLAVWMAGEPLTTAVAVGFLVLMGVMFNDGILLGTYLHQQFLTPPTSVHDLHQRIFVAGVRRRRPALMTNLTTVLALIPILFADGRGAEIMRPMVLPVIGGMIADLLSLFSVPVLYAWWWERRLARTTSSATLPHSAPVT